MAKKQYIWKFTQAGRTVCHNEFCLQQSTGKKRAKSIHLSSLRKCRQKAKELVGTEDYPSHNNWIEEKWYNDDYCVVINSGANTFFSFSRIEVL